MSGGATRTTAAAPDCRGELVARERRSRLDGIADAALTAAVEAHVERCASCRQLREAGADLDDSGAVDAGDAARIGRLAATATRWATDQRRRSGARLRTAGALGAGRWRRMAAAAVVLIVAGGTASAAVWWRHAPAPPATAVTRTMGSSRSPAAAAPAPSARRSTAAPAAALPPSATESPPAVERADDVAPATGGAPRVAARRTRPGGIPSPAALLRDASDARRKGDADRAIALYRRLEATFPVSSEAKLAAIPLGGLLLDRALPRAALAQYDGYLGAARAGALAPEALYGRGRALAVLGDRGEERRNWERLLADFPASAYAAHGRRRLAELR